MSRSSSQSAPARIPCVCFPQLVDSLVRAMEFVTLRAGGREGSAVFFATEQLVCVPVKTALRLGIEIFEHIVEPAGPTGPQRLEFLDSPSECSVVSRLRPPFLCQSTICASFGMVFCVAPRHQRSRSPTRSPQVSLVFAGVATRSEDEASGLCSILLVRRCARHVTCRRCRQG